MRDLLLCSKEGEHSYNREYLRYLRRRYDSFCASPSTGFEKTVEGKAPPPPPPSLGGGSKSLIPDDEVDQPPPKSPGGGSTTVDVGGSETLVSGQPPEAVVVNDGPDDAGEKSEGACSFS
ncbi:hypothetical protein SOVF_036240 [Spinacia oleracea]|nr:hypothetical protein SOVF_036240 [Spinacia oleracea]